MTKKETTLRSIGHIRAGEPTFTLRAQDRMAIKTIQKYRHLAAQGKLGKDFLESIDESLAEFKKWQDDNANLVKSPD